MKSGPQPRHPYEATSCLPPKPLRFSRCNLKPGCVRRPLRGRGQGSARHVHPQVLHTRRGCACMQWGEVVRRGAFIAQVAGRENARSCVMGWCPLQR